MYISVRGSFQLIDSQCSSSSNRFSTAQHLDATNPEKDPPSIARPTVMPRAASYIQACSEAVRPSTMSATAGNTMASFSESSP